MKIRFTIGLLLVIIGANAQTKQFTISNIKLPAEVSYYDHQFSGLYIYNKALFFMSESRLQDKAPALLYSIALNDIEQQLVDTTYALPYKKWPIYNAELLRNSIKQNGDDYEGFEAIVIKNGTVFLTVETATPSNNCYIVKGLLNDTALILYNDFLLKLPKPTTDSGTHIYNAGFEALATTATALLPIFEYNSFVTPKPILPILLQSTTKKLPSKYNFNTQVPFRITDITSVSKNEYTAINYFYKGGGEDVVYRVPLNDVANDTLIRKNNEYESYCRLISISIKKNKKLSWKPLWELPTKYSGYNWEGIAAYKKGYFIINDKYTPTRPYSSVLLLLQPKYDK